MTRRTLAAAAAAAFIALAMGLALRPPGDRAHRRASKVETEVARDATLVDVTTERERTEASLLTEDAPSNGASSTAGDRRTAVVFGRFEGLWVNVTKAPSQRPAAILRRLDDPRRPNTFRQPLGNDGAFRFEDLAAGRYRLRLSELFTSTVVPIEFELAERESREAVLTTLGVRPCALSMDLVDASGAAVPFRRMRVWIRPRWSTAFETVVRTVAGARRRLDVDLLPGDYELDAVVDPYGAIAVLPTRRLHARFTVPAPATGEDGPAVAVPVRLTTKEAGHRAVVRGRIALERGELPYGFHAQVRARDGGVESRKLKLRENGAFTVLVHVDLVQGPQVELISDRSSDVAGPFALGDGVNDLGTIRFRPQEASVSSESEERSATFFFDAMPTETIEYEPASKKSGKEPTSRKDD